MSGTESFSPFSSVDSDTALRQGDILTALFDENSAPQIGMIVTADCDIAQDKAGDELTILQIVSAERYIREAWARRESERIFKKQLEVVLQPLNSAIMRRDDSLAPLTTTALADWLSSSTVERILSAVGLTPKANSDLYRSMDCTALYLAQRSHLDDMTLLKQMWSVLQTSTKTIKGRLNEALDSSRGAADFYFLPYIPTLGDVGYVIRLRSFGTVPKKSISTTRTDWRISGDLGAYYRVARLRDGLRFSVVQKMAILFSRIGLSEEFEGEAGLASEMIVESIHCDICGERA